MVRVNENYLKLKAGYLFPEIGRRVAAFQEKNPKAKIIRLGIGDVVLPLPKAVVRAMRSAVGEMGNKKTFRGYGPEQGYPFLIEAIIKNDFVARGVSIRPSEVFVSDGSKCDTGNIQEIFSADCRVAVTDPVYPVYVDSTIMEGRNLVTLPTTEENGFTPPLPTEKVGLIYLCSPNNPTGTALTREVLEKWVTYARENGSVIFFDAAYEAYITDKNIPHSIYEIPGADEVAIEFRSFSKTAGFTGTRCAYLVIPEKLQGTSEGREKVSLNALWRRRHTTKFNGVSYPVQRGAAACFTAEGKREIRKMIAYYLDNAKLIRDGLSNAGLKVFGGINAPYLWAKTPNGIGSWDFFQKLLQEAHVVGIPGAGFGPSGEGFLRLSAFGFRDQIKEAVSRIKALLSA